MIFFRCIISHNDLLILQKGLSPESYCITKEASDSYHYGIVLDMAYNKFLDVLPSETLEQLEYLERSEFKEQTSAFLEERNISDKFIGNVDLATKM
jgi:hypothetical protein